MKKTAVVALGGNAILPPDSKGDIHTQFANTRKSLVSVLHFLKKDYKIVITHGNGPQAGDEILRNELARHIIPELPLGVIDAATGGWMGYMIQQSLHNILIKNNIYKDVVTIPTQVIVDENDPMWNKPTKPIGRCLNEQEALELKKDNIPIIEYSKGCFRRVVPSPFPKGIVEKNIIKALLEREIIVIAVGGGGIPVYITEENTLEGLDAVIDKDLSSSVLALEIGADILVILTGVPCVYLNYNKPDMKKIESMKASEARKYLNEGQFPQGSMGPKILAACEFIEKGGKEVLITSLDSIEMALDYKEGTRIYPDV